jgi:2-polyprenyl-3-methyl-5-hydroxy-6-metoxy-1,4-benzoquinol methylase
MLAATCRLCASADLRPHFDVRGSHLDRCSSCGFVQVRDQPTAEALRELYGNGYFERGKYDDEFAQARETQRRLALLERAGVPEGGRVLDAGCATGDFLSAGQGSYEMWGLDVSAYATELARARNPSCAHRIFTGFVEDQDLEPGTFDAVALWDVVEHLWDPRLVLSRLVTLLRPGGSLLLSTPDIGAVVARLMQRRWAFMTPPEHLGFFNRRSLDHVLGKDLGLEIVVSSASGKWANLGFLVYKLRRVFPDVVPAKLVDRFGKSAAAALSVYVPTLDVRYVAARKREA